MRFRIIGLAPSIAVGLMALGGCASPMLAIDAPGFSLGRSPAPAAEPASMAEATQKLNHVRAHYYEAIKQQTDQVQGTSTGLVWLGTLVAGMAAGNVHRDGILAASLIGGTTYGLSRSQMDARRVQVWLEGIKALDCAKDASRPLDIGVAHRQLLERAAAVLPAKRAEVQLARDQLQAAVDASKAGAAAKVKAAKAVLEKTDLALAGADQTQAAALQLLLSSNGGELSVTVDRIATRVTVAMNDIAVDLSSVRQLLAGLGGFAATFAPGAGLDTGLADALGRYKTPPAAGGAVAQTAVPTAELDAAVDALASRLSELALAQKQVNGLLLGIDRPAVAAALKKCDVAGVAAPLVLTPASRDFTKGEAAAKGFDISGGTPPYVVTPLDALPEGMSIAFNGGFADTAQIKVSKDAAAGEFRLQVSDSGTTRRKQQFVVQIAPKSGGGGGAAGPGEEPPASPEPGAAPGPSALWTELAASIQKMASIKNFKGVDIQVVSAKASKTGVDVVVKCSKAQPAVTAALLREQLAVADKATVMQLTKDSQLGDDFAQIVVSPDPPCNGK